MNGQASVRKSSILRLKKSDFLWTLIPALLWMGGISLRQNVISASCPQVPEKCSKAALPAIDQLSFGMESGPADGYSYLTQNFSGALALGVPALWSFSSSIFGFINPSAAITAAGVDLVLVLQTASINGMFTELSHLVFQRPRPFVYYNPLKRGADPSNYVSFYSGHTSFSAAMLVALFLILRARRAPPILIVLSVVSAEALVMATAYFRIMAGRHFLTDVAVGAVAGTGAAWLVFRRHWVSGNSF
jgi:membrane-associated phospholipid phosphatase